MAMKKTKLMGAILALAGAIGLPGAAIAGTVNPVVWSTPTNISGDSDVSTLGTLVGAFNMVGNTVTINGVTFTSFTFPFMAQSATNGNFNLTEAPGHMLAYTTLGSASAPFSSLSANYQALLSSAVSTDDNNVLTLTMNGLVAGQAYQFQWWLNASSDVGSGPGFRTTASSANNVTLDDNTTNTQGGVGQFAIGTFTAVGTVQQIAFTGTDATQAPTINAFQLRAVPEPSVLGVLVLGAGTLGLLQRFRRRSR